MSKIARKITKKASTVALAASLLMQAAPVNAAEIVDAGDENKTTVVEEASENEQLEEKNEVVSTEKNTEEVNEVSENVSNELVQASEVKETAKTVEKSSVEDTLKEEKNDDDEVVTFPDPNFEKYVRKVSFREKGPITKRNLKGVRFMTIDPDLNIKSLEGIQYMPDLIYLEVNTDIDTSPVRGCKKLQQLYSDEKNFDFSIANDLPHLNTLGLYHSLASNLNDLKNPHIKYLVLEDCPNLSDVSQLANLPLLKELRIMGSGGKRVPVSDLSCLAGSTWLTDLICVNTNIGNDSLETLANLPVLTEIILEDCNITDASGFFKNIDETKKVGLWLNKNKISDPTQLVQEKYPFIAAAYQDVNLPEITAKAGDVVYKLPYDKNYITEVQVDENVGRYNPETNEITFFNVTNDKDVSYKVRMNKNLNAIELFNYEVSARPAYDYSANITQKIRIENPVESIKADNETKASSTSAVISNNSETAKTGDVGVLGLLSAAAMSAAGMLKLRRKK